MVDPTGDRGDFIGAKLALFTGDGAILTYLRDEKPGLPFAGMWDLPGGAREAGETPQACALRELNEEFGLDLPTDRLVWAKTFPAMLVPSRQAWFFGAHLTPADISAIRFGDEGQGFQVMDWAAFIRHPLVIPAMRDRATFARDALGVRG